MAIPPSRHPPLSSPRDGEPHLKKLGVHVCGFETSPYGVEWIPFDTHSQVPEIVKTVPHLAFVVDNFDMRSKESRSSFRRTRRHPACGSRSSWMMGPPIELLEFAPDSD